MCGHYYNPLYPGLYAYNHWKWNYLKGDVNYDAKVDMGDITTMNKAFGSYACIGNMPVFSEKWNFNCDVDDSPWYRWRSREIDMGDLINALANYGMSSSQWQPPP